MLKTLSKLILLLLDFVVIFLNGVVIYDVISFMPFRPLYVISDTAIAVLSVFNICFAIYKMKQGKYGKALYGGISLVIILLYFIFVSYLMFYR